MKKVCKIDICKLKYFKGSTMVSKKKKQYSLKF